MFAKGAVGIRVIGASIKGELTWDTSESLTLDNLVGKLSSEVGGGILGAELSVGISGSIQYISCKKR